jgi:hypothetical protein
MLFIYILALASLFNNSFTLINPLWIIALEHLFNKFRRPAY